MQWVPINTNAFNIVANVIASDPRERGNLILQCEIASSSGTQFP
jgi:hypothetical protein